MCNYKTYNGSYLSIYERLLVPSFLNVSRVSTFPPNKWLISASFVHGSWGMSLLHVGQTLVRPVGAYVHRIKARTGPAGAAGAP